MGAPYPGFPCWNGGFLTSSRCPDLVESQGTCDSPCSMCPVFALPVTSSDTCYACTAMLASRWWLGLQTLPSLLPYLGLRSWGHTSVSVNIGSCFRGSSLILEIQPVFPTCLYVLLCSFYPLVIWFCPRYSVGESPIFFSVAQCLLWDHCM